MQNAKVNFELSSVLLTLRKNPEFQAPNLEQILISKFKLQKDFGHRDFSHLMLFSISGLIAQHRRPLVVRPFRVVRTRLKPRTTFLNSLSLEGAPFLSLRGTPPLCHCEEVRHLTDDEAISSRDSSFYSEQAPQSPGEAPGNFQR